MKLRERLEKLRAACPHGPTRYGQLYNEKSETERRKSRITLWSLWQAEDGGWLCRGHVFEAKKAPKTPREWHEWFTTRVDDNGRDVGELTQTRLQHIHKNIRTAISVRTGDKQWTLVKVIGWAARAINTSRVARVGDKRRKASKKRRSRG
jgi:hypothetical protein